MHLMHLLWFSTHVYGHDLAELTSVLVWEHSHMMLYFRVGMLEKAWKYLSLSAKIMAKLGN